MTTYLVKKNHSMLTNSLLLEFFYLIYPDHSFQQKMKLQRWGGQRWAMRQHGQAARPPC